MKSSKRSVAKTTVRLFSPAFHVLIFVCGAGTFCGVFRRQALDRGAMLLQADKIVTGHNADDIAETCLMNSAWRNNTLSSVRVLRTVLRGDVSRLGRCVAIVTGDGSSMPRCKPFKYTYEKEIVM